jgi:hypothetical protein
VRSAWVEAVGPFGRTPTPTSGTAAQRAGKRYERHALKHLSKELGNAFIPSPWIRYQEAGNVTRWCQPDGILHIEDFIAIFEIKIRFTSAAWWQLRKLYEPVIRRAFCASRIGVFLVTRAVDPSEPFPENFSVLDGLSPAVLRTWPLDRTGVVLWRP